jgi:hypothetical protein
LSSVSLTSKGWNETERFPIAICKSKFQTINMGELSISNSSDQTINMKNEPIVDLDDKSVIELPNFID